MNLEQIEEKLFEKLNDNNYKTENFNFIDNFIEKNKTKTIKLFKKKLMILKNI